MKLVHPLTKKYDTLILQALGTGAFCLYRLWGQEYIPYTFTEEYIKGPNTEHEQHITEPFRFTTGHYILLDTLPYPVGVKLGVNAIKHKDELARFDLVQQPNCCGILVSTMVWVREDLRNRGLGKVLNSLRIDIARRLGYSVLLCTDRVNNEPQRKILKANGWQDIFTFHNKRSGNEVAISVVKL